MPHDVWHSWPSAVTAVTYFASCVVLLLAAAHDVAARTVPNWMSVAIALLGLAAAFAQDRLIWSVGLAVFVFLTAAFCWRRGWMGGADVKLLGAITLVLPPGVVSVFLFVMAMAGAVHAIAYLIAGRVVTPPAPVPPWRVAPRSLLRRALRAERWRISRRGPLPYVCAIAFGFLFVILHGASQ